MKLRPSKTANSHGICIAVEPVPMLISDWMMPVMDGLQLCRKIRAEKRASYTYIILLTALSGKPTTSKAWKPGQTTLS